MTRDATVREADEPTASVLTDIIRDVDRLTQGVDDLLAEREALRQLVREAIEFLDNEASVVDARDWLKAAKIAIGYDDVSPTETH